MARDDRIVGGDFALRHMEVGSADAAGGDCDQHVRSRRWRKAPGHAPERRAGGVELHHETFDHPAMLLPR
jgi:hypothetical protein